MEHDEEKLGSRDLAQRLRNVIEQGDYEPGAQLPSYRELAGEYGIAINTARDALRLLEQWGVVVVQHGRGTFVAPSDADRSPEDQLRVVRGELEDVRVQIRQTGNALAAVENRLSQVVERMGRGV